jgi:hypothetical protein
MTDYSELFAARRAVYKYYREAWFDGDEFYIAVQPCRNGHQVPIRRVFDRQCTECLAAAAAGK